jgi:hypothetical protein
VGGKVLRTPFLASFCWATAVKAQWIKQFLMGPLETERTCLYILLQPATFHSLVKVDNVLAWKYYPLEARHKNICCHESISMYV